MTVCLEGWRGLRKTSRTTNPIHDSRRNTRVFRRDAWIRSLDIKNWDRKGSCFNSGRKLDLVSDRKQAFSIHVFDCTRISLSTDLHSSVLLISSQKPSPVQAEEHDERPAPGGTEYEELSPSSSSPPSSGTSSADVSWPEEDEEEDRLSPDSAPSPSSSRPWHAAVGSRQLKLPSPQWLLPTVSVHVQKQQSPPSNLKIVCFLFCFLNVKNKCEDSRKIGQKLGKSWRFACEKIVSDSGIV